MFLFLFISESKYVTEIWRMYFNFVNEKYNMDVEFSEEYYATLLSDDDGNYFENINNILCSTF